MLAVVSLCRGAACRGLFVCPFLRRHGWRRGGTDDLSRARSPVIYIDGDYNWHGATSFTCRLEVPLADRFFRLLVDLLADTLQYMSTAHVALVTDYGQ